MSETDEIKNLMKKLVRVIGNMAETLQTLEGKISFSNQQIIQLSKQIEILASKLEKLDMDVEDEFAKIGKESSQINFQDELKTMEEDLKNIPDDVLDDELKSLLEEEEKTKIKEKKDS